MTRILLELDPKIVQFSEERFPDGSTSFVYAHLRHYCSKFEPLPAIIIRTTGDGVFVTRGHKYLRAALDLSRRRIRAIVDSASDNNAVAQLVATPEVERLDWTAVVSDQPPTLEAWHVFFFDQPLGPVEQQAFTAQVGGFFNDLGELGGQLLEPVGFIEGGLGAEFRALTPVGDESWYGRFLAACTAFSEKHVGIVSYQGLRFPGKKTEAVPPPGAASRE